MRNRQGGNDLLISADGALCSHLTSPTATSLTAGTIASGRHQYRVIYTLVTVPVRVSGIQEATWLGIATSNGTLTLGAS